MRIMQTEHIQLIYIYIYSIYKVNNIKIIQVLIEFVMGISKTVRFIS